MTRNSTKMETQNKTCIAWSSLALQMKNSGKRRPRKDQIPNRADRCVHTQLRFATSPCQSRGLYASDKLVHEHSNARTRTATKAWTVTSVTIIAVHTCCAQLVWHALSIYETWTVTCSRACAMVHTVWASKANLVHYPTSTDALWNRSRTRLAIFVCPVPPCWTFLKRTSWWPKTSSVTHLSKVNQAAFWSSTCKCALMLRKGKLFDRSLRHVTAQGQKWQFSRVRTKSWSSIQPCF